MSAGELKSPDLTNMLQVRRFREIELHPEESEKRLDPVETHCPLPSHRLLLHHGLQQSAFDYRFRDRQLQYQGPRKTLPL